MAGKRSFEEALKALAKAEELEPANGMIKTQIKMAKAQLEELAMVPEDDP